MTGGDLKSEQGGKLDGHSGLAQDKIVTTHHEITVNGELIKFSAVTGSIVFKEEDDKEEEKARATIFFVAYSREARAGDQRPITFSFNGGPGSSSVWLHMGLLGPQRVVMGEEGDALPPPYRLTENAYSLLDKSDLVFIDPVSTGLSRSLPGEDASEYHDFKRDIESVGDFIRLYCTRYKRWHSPKFLIGESYGTTRAAGLAEYLHNRHGMFLNGVMLVSSILSFQTARFTPGNDLPYLLFMPTYAATAWYHGRAAPDLLQRPLEEVVQQARAFALGPYAAALLQGSTLGPEEADNIAQELSRYSGLSKTYLRQCNLRIHIMRFVKELLRDQRRSVGRLDSRFAGIDRDAAGESFEYDPSYAAIQGTYTATFNHYLRQVLGFESDLTYEILNPQIFPRWSYKDHQNEFVNVGEALRKAMSVNPALRVLVANGYFDLATPFLATEYTFSHLSLDASLQDNIVMHYYPAGHMMYVQLASLAQLKSDLATFIDAAAPAGKPVDN